MKELEETGLREIDVRFFPYVNSSLWLVIIGDSRMKSLSILLEDTGQEI